MIVYFFISMSPSIERETIIFKLMQVSIKSRVIYFSALRSFIHFYSETKCFTVMEQFHWAIYTFRNNANTSTTSLTSEASNVISDVLLKDTKHRNMLH